MVTVEVCAPHGRGWGFEVSKRRYLMEGLGEGCDAVEDVSRWLQMEELRRPGRGRDLGQCSIPWRGTSKVREGG